MRQVAVAIDSLGDHRDYRYGEFGLIPSSARRRDRDIARNVDHRACKP
jgi:hypothetical protein